MIKNIIYIICGLILFLYSLKQMTNSLTNIYNNKIEHIISKYIKSDFSALLVGIFSTALCQSSNAITIITLSLISSKYISFDKGLIIIIGSNIGTTFTSILISFDFYILIPIFLILGYILFLTNKNKDICTCLISLGTIFFSLDILSSNFMSIFNEEYIYPFIKTFNNSNLFSFIFGTFFSSLIQSSSASIGIIQKLCQDNMLKLTSSISFVLGANIGTTLTGLITSLTCDKKTKTVALVNVLFNFITTIPFMLFIDYYSNMLVFIQNLFNLNAMSVVALSHFIFNLISVILFYLIFTIYKSNLNMKKR